MSKSDRQVMRHLGSTEALALFTQALTGSAAGAVRDYALLARPWNVPLGEISVPVHCWQGTDDTFVPPAHAGRSRSGSPAPGSPRGPAKVTSP